MTVAAVQPGDAYALRLIKDGRHRSARAARDVADWLAYLQVEKKAPRTLDAYERTVAFLLREFPDKEVTEFTSGDLTQVLSRFPERSRHMRRIQLNQFFTWAEAQDIIDKNPMRKVPSVKHPPRRLKEIFTAPEVSMLKGLPEPDGTLMAILFMTGIRLSEATGLQRKHIHIDVDDPRLSHISITEALAKGAKPRNIRLRGLLTRVWDMVDGWDRDDYLWYLTPAGVHITRRSRMSQSSFYLWWNRCLDQAGIEAAGRTVHSTRHTFATHWVRTPGAKIETLKEILGHASIKTTYDEYVHLNEDDILADMERVEAYMAGLEG